MLIGMFVPRGKKNIQTNPSFLIQFIEHILTKLKAVSKSTFESAAQTQD